MFNDHTLSVVTDLSLIGPQINNIDYIAVAAITTETMPKAPNIYNASILMPPTEVLMAWADGNPYVLQSAYPEYLKTTMPDDMIAALLVLMTKKNVVLYIPKDEYNIFGAMLLNHIYFVYGITCNTPTTQFSVDISKVPFILSRFYMIDAMDYGEFINAYPANQLLPPFVINKLAAEVHPFNRSTTFDEYARYFNDLNKSKGIVIADPTMVKVVDK